MNLLSVGDILDKLVIENIKIFNIREKIHTSTNDEEVVELNEKMLLLNSNRSKLAQAFDEKLQDVIDGEENCIIKKYKTYTNRNEKTK